MKLARFNEHVVRQLFQEPWSLEIFLRSLGYKYVCGVDEVGTGAIFGPVVACAVVFNLNKLDTSLALKDAKELTPKARIEAYERVKGVIYAVEVSVVEIDEINEVQNVMAIGALARSRAVQAIKPHLKDKNVVYLVDHFHVPECGLEQLNITRGDTLVQTITAAGIYGKYTRDRIIDSILEEHPEWECYGLKANKGYRSRQHLNAIREKGLTPQHRFYMREVAQIIQDREWKEVRE